MYNWTIAAPVPSNGLNLSNFRSVLPNSADCFSAFLLFAVDPPCGDHGETAHFFAYVAAFHIASNNLAR